MLKTLMMSAAVSALMVSGALAQASPPANPPAAKDEATSSPKFIQAQSAEQWVFSKFKGTDVLGPDNSKVGSVTDLLFDRHGKIEGLIVGVGGFLGIGEKNVAIDMSAFQAVPYGSGTSATGGANTGASDNDPTRVNLKVTWTKDQLKNAPDFQYYRAPARTSERPGGSTTGMAPRPTAPAPSPRQ
jgi:sporulation protein YlmC with PRC-barrel domain